MSARKDGQADDLVSALLDFQAKPGQYALNLRQPEVLHAQVKHVLMICLDKPVPGLFIAENMARQVKQAAAFFLKAALLREGADHYTLLGVPPHVGAGVLRDHYRLWMRLTHPDQADADLSWPQDTASRINLAHDVLSDSMLRAQYDASLIRSDASASPPPRASDFRARAYRASHEYPLQRPSHKKFMVLGALFTLLGLAVALLFWDATPPSTITASIPGPAPLATPAAVSQAVSMPQPALPEMPAPSETMSVPAAQNVPRPVVASVPAVRSPLMPMPRQPEQERLQEHPKDTALERPVASTPAAAPAASKPSHPSFEEVRPTLDQLHQAMSKGDWLQLEAAIDPALRRTAGAQALLRAYRHFSAQAKSVRVTGAKVQFLEPTSAQVHVEVQTRMEVAGQDSSVVELNWRAVFLRDGPKFNLIRLHAGGE